MAQFGEDVVEVSGFDAGRSGVRVAVHWVALPDGDVARGLHGGDVGGKVLGDFGGAVAGDEGYLADFLGWIDDVKEGD